MVERIFEGPLFSAPKKYQLAMDSEGGCNNKMLINKACNNLITVSIVLSKEYCWVLQHVWRTLSHLALCNTVIFHEPLSFFMLGY